MAVTLSYRFAMRRRTAAGWTSLNEVLLQSEWGHESDTNRLKIGDGVSAWNDLPYYGLAPTGVTAGDYGMDPTTPEMVGFTVDEDGLLTAARTVPLVAGNGLSFDIDPNTGAVTISVNSFVADNRITQAGDTRVTPNGDIRVTR